MADLRQSLLNADFSYLKAVAEKWGKGNEVDLMLTVDKRDDSWKGNEVL